MRTVDRARGRWREILLRLGVADRFLRNKHGPCPLCGGKDRFRFDDKNGSGSYYCNQCGPGLGLMLLQKMNGWDYATACREVDEIIGTDRPMSATTRTPAPDPEIERDRRRRQIVEILEEADAPEIVRDYLAGRGLRTFPEVLRGHRGIAYFDDGRARGRYPAVLAPVVGPDGQLQSAHRVYVAAVTERKKTLPPVDTISGAAVRLFDHDGALGVAEGIENAIACYEMFSLPTWSALTTVGIESFVPPADLRRLVIFGDTDASFAGQKAAYVLAARLARERRDLAVEVALPDRAGVDWLDVLVGRRAAA